MRKIGLICKRDRQEPEDILRDLVPWLLARGAEVYTGINETRMAGEIGVGPVKSCPFELMQEQVDMVVVLGGDGTMLGAARQFAESGIPILGVNLGGLGFITEVPPTQIFEVLEDALAGRSDIEERMMLSAQITRASGGKETYLSLNDIAVSKGATARIVDFRTSVDGKFINIFKADGVIVASPTGSTAYSMSAGGPIVYPTVECMLLTPICPHMLTNRPIVLSADSTVEIMLGATTDDAIITYDGVMAGQFNHGDTITIRRSKHKARLVMPRDRDHFHMLRSKLKWGER